MSQQATEGQRAMQKTLDGVVVSDKMEKTVVVSITRQVKHPLYKKYIRRTQKYFAHDETNQCGVGDSVRIIESRPMSKKKRWRVQEIISKAL